MALMSIFSVTVRHRGLTTARAFSFASLSIFASKNLKLVPRKSQLNFKNHKRSISFSNGTPSSLQLSTEVVEELKTKMDIEHPAFDIVKKDFIEEYGTPCTIYRHKKSGAELLSVSTDDDNKVFGITFRTPPTDSTGVAHILEHSVLCGSRKYKTKDPFVQLLQGSLQTFLNAFTYPDRTCYVVASQNKEDFYNLVNVYADAVFHPRAVSDEKVFAQEGWHLELEDEKEPLTYKGVVYNEMKGVYSSPDSLLMRHSQRSIFPDNVYAVDSGGDPDDIPNLSYEQFVEFHRKFYHPANSRIYFYGDDDVAARLELMDEYLSDFGPSPESKPSSKVEWQKKVIDEPQWKKLPYPASADQPNSHMVLVNWLVNDDEFSDTEELIAALLNHLLVGTSQSVLYKTLMESGLGTDITGGGLSDELLQATFSMGLKGVDPANVEAVQELVVNTLEKVSNDGFSDDDIASTMNTIEFGLREFNTGSFPKGLSFMLGAMSKWIYDGSPTDALKFEKPLAELKQMIQKDGSKVFKDFAKKYLVENNHRVTIEMFPLKTMEEDQIKKEVDHLDNIKKSLSVDDLENIIAETNQLKKLQSAEDSPEDRATIPSLALEDLKREVSEYPIAVSENEDKSGVTVIRHELASTSGIAYVTFCLDVSALSFDDLILLPIYIGLMTETGAGKYSDIALSQRIGTYTGGVSPGLMITKVRPDGVEDNVVHDSDTMLTKIRITGKATSDNVDELFSIFNLIMTDANLDSQKKVVEMLKETKSRLESSIQSSGHTFVNTRLQARYTASGYIGEKMGGISSLDTINSLIEEAETDWDSILLRLVNMRKTTLDSNTCRDGMLLDITGDSAVLKAIEPSISTFLKDLPGDAEEGTFPDFYNVGHPWVIEAKKEMKLMAPIKDEGFVVPTQVSYVGKGGRLFDEGERISASTAVVSKFLRTGYLWDHVRVIGGAYGGFCTFNGQGVFTYLSYRDPNLEKTIDVYDATGDALLEAYKQLENDPDALATAIIGTVGEMDGALSPNQKGSIAFNRWLSRESAETRQRKRDEVINTNASDFKLFAERLKGMKDESVAVVSSLSKFEVAAAAGKEMETKNIL